VIIREKLLAIAVLALISFSPVLAQNAPGAPGALPSWTAGSKEAVGTATSTNSHVWFTLEGGVLTEVYYPRLDTANLRTLEFAVSDGRTTWVESKDLKHSLERLSDSALLYQQISSDPAGKFKITKTYASDPQRDALLIEVTFEAPAGYKLYVLSDPALKNSGYGDTAYSQDGALVAEKEDTACALVSSPAFSQASSGFVGKSDGYTDLLLHHKLSWQYDRAEKGNVLQAAKLGGANHYELALGFGATGAAAIEAAKKSLARKFAAVSAEYVAGWKEYLKSLRKVDPRYASEFQLAAMVLKAHEDKTYRGAMIASMSIPWGMAVKADTPGVGGYHLVWARDLYEVASGLMAAGDRDAADRALSYLYTVQQEPDGRFPQNSWLDGKPYWTALQMDEISYPMVLAWQLGRTDADTWSKHVRPEAEFVMAHGPITQQERWEEVPGYSPSTIAAEIAGLVCAAEIARKNGAIEDADRYMRAADDWAAHIEAWMVTTTGHLGKGPGALGYYIRIDNNTDPNDGYMLDTRNGGGVWDERDVVDAGFLEFVRLGIRPANDPIIQHSVEIVDATIRVETPNGPSFYRYNHDGYGETYFGGPWLGEGMGRIWPIFTGERGEYEIAAGRDATPYILAMLKFANAGGMIPEQVWDQAEPTRAGFVFGRGTGSATPLAWSMAEFLRLVVCAEEKRIVETPSIVAEHFLKKQK
jgi:glucoamylase